MARSKVNWLTETAEAREVERARRTAQVVAVAARNSVLRSDDADALLGPDARSWGGTVARRRQMAVIAARAAAKDGLIAKPGTCTWRPEGMIQTCSAGESLYPIQPNLDEPFKIVHWVCRHHRAWALNT